MVGYKVGTKAYQLWDPKTQSIIISQDIIFNERINPPAVPAPPVELSEIIWDGELTGDVQGLTQVGDTWDKTDVESPPSAPVTNTQPIEPLIDEEEDQPQNLDALPNPLPLEPPHQKHPLPDLPAQPCQHQTELELLGDLPIIEGPRPHCLPERYHIDSPPPSSVE